MMTKEQAAKFFIVAWVKDWSMRTYLDTVGEGERIDWADAHKLFSWMPKDPGWFIRNTRVRRYAATAMRSLNDKLWDALDNAKKLALHAEVMQWDCGDAVQTMDAARREQHKLQKEYRAAMLGVRKSVDEMRRGSGHAWGVVK